MDLMKLRKAAMLKRLAFEGREMALEWVKEAQEIASQEWDAASQIQDPVKRQERLDQIPNTPEATRGWLLRIHRQQLALDTANSVALSSGA
jgi:hypothetical protein